MIKRKFGLCVDCPPASPEKLLIAGRCNYHYQKFRREISLTKRPPVSRFTTAKKIIEAPTEDLAFYFTHHNTWNKWICENCKCSLSPTSSKVASSCQAHIIPKAHFKSVQGHLLNHLTLGGLFQPCSCHGQYDSSWHNAQRMPVFDLAIQRFNQFKHLINPEEYRWLPAVFRELL